MQTKLEEIAERIINFNLTIPQYRGVSRSYGKTPTLSQTAISSRIENIKIDLDFTNRLLENLTKKDELKYLETKLIQNHLIHELFSFSERCNYKESISEYFECLWILNVVYVTRNYSSLNIRTKHIISTLKEIPRLIRETLSNLDKNLPLNVLELDIFVLKENIDYLQKDLPDYLRKLTDIDIKEKFKEVNEIAIKKLKELHEILEKNYLPNCKKEFALGLDKYSKLIKYNEGFEFDIEKLYEIAVHDLERNRNELLGLVSTHGEKILIESNNDHPSKETLIEEGIKSTDRAKQFVLQHDIIDIPDGADTVIVIETPPSMRATTFAAMNAVGLDPDSEDKSSYYYITPPDNSWSLEEQDDFLKEFSIGMLDSTSIHEVWPGHHLHAWHVLNVKSKIIQELGFSISTIEGWAHYCEELAVELNYDLSNPLFFKIGQIRSAILRNCRFIASIAMHTKNMTMEEAKRLFMDKGDFSEKSALMEARRGTVNPLYISYTLGKLMIYKLRKDYKNMVESKGEIYNLKKFHNEFMKYGYVPISLIREMMIEDSSLSII